MPRTAWVDKRTKRPLDFLHRPECGDRHPRGHCTGCYGNGMWEIFDDEEPDDIEERLRGHLATVERGILGQFRKVRSWKVEHHRDSVVDARHGFASAMKLWGEQERAKHGPGVDEKLSQQRVKYLSGTLARAWLLHVIKKSQSPRGDERR